MTPDQIRKITDPLERHRAALEGVERARQMVADYAAIRAEAVQELKQGRTWKQVATLLGVSEPTAWNIAHPKASPPKTNRQRSRGARRSAPGSA